MLSSALFATFLTNQVEEATPPLIDFDWTVAVQFALFLAMFLILSRYLWKPYFKVRDGRHAEIEGAREQAQTLAAEARRLVADFDARFGAAKQRGAEERARLRAEAAAHERQAVGTARQEADRKVKEERVKVIASAAAARATLENEATALGNQIVEKILGRKVA
jgi:F0F1-type ATP synthase membrane subunit b/b'